MTFLTALEDKTGKSVKEETLAGKLVLLYFASSWCPACQTFTPLLKSLYETVQQETATTTIPLEIVHVSSDYSAESLQEYAMQHHGDWLRIPYNNELRQMLKKKYGVFAGKEQVDFPNVARRSGIPTLVVISPTGQELAILDCDSAKVCDQVQTQQGSNFLKQWESFQWTK